MSSQWKEITVDGKVKFKVPVELEFIKKVGSGAYGTVASFQTKSGQKLAVKKVSDAFHDLIDGKRILREVKLLRMECSALCAERATCRGFGVG
eukprot:6469312-Amphidinium_carterae.3